MKSLQLYTVISRDDISTALCEPCEMGAHCTDVHNSLV